ncbi:serine hydrolase domain-containing protein [Chondromyces apiculatus]|uniref:Beta-lactamase-related domain-containing protein n=1 Tax=Chondromyces apiculatus DSM 436 TaxID=1192034 RepID=A0A017T911_9BACT|nr:serine hydrolase domain-containing protein [Chondromyces apiculatus]EYF05729.1 Hypothetical protein CAP_3019 [Chondromyces apiculatus DSM 436]
MSLSPISARLPAVLPAVLPPVLLALVACAAAPDSTPRAEAPLPPAASPPDPRPGERASPPADPRHPLDQALVIDATERPFNGVVLIADGPRPISTRVSGFADRERSVPMTLAHRFVIASLTKQMTAALILQHVDQGKLDLDTSLASALSLDAPWAPRVKVRHLLNHTSGITALDAPLRTEPGATYAYSNLGYDLLGTLLARLAARPFPDAAARLFEACGMTDTGALGTPAPSGLVPGYSEQPDGTLVREPPLDMSEHLPSGGMVSSASDLVRWNLCLHGGRILSPASYTAMTTPSTTFPNRWGELGGGFGVRLSAQDGLTEIAHTGYLPGYIATMTFYPRLRRTLVILENIAWRPDDMRRVFAPHDKIRDIVRAETLKALKAPEDPTSPAPPAPPAPPGLRPLPR